jgi:predicted N-formylglutamate amidohydrolase
MNASAEQWVKVFNGESKPTGEGGRNSNNMRPIVLVCEHASNFVPPNFNGLGLSEKQLQSHIAWDPGALDTAKLMVSKLGATLVASEVSRLIYDCNRPPHSSTAIPLSSEQQSIPGNSSITPADKEQRVETYYRPFEAALTQCIDSLVSPLVVTIHSFTPVYLGKKRDVEIGVLYDTDQRFADAFMRQAGDQPRFNIQRNQPYAPKDGVTHTLTHHALSRGLLNVMLEIRNDLISTLEQQQKMAAYLANLIDLSLLENT